MKVKHLILFDIDGTLLRTRGAGKIAFERAFLEVFGIEKVWAGLNAQGRTDRDIIDELCLNSLKRRPLQEEQAELEARFIAHFDTLIWNHPQFELMPGVPELLNQLSTHAEVAVGIETGNLKQTAEIKLRRGQVDHHFEVGAYGCDSCDRREIVRTAIDRAHRHFSFTGPVSVTVIGDSPNDVLAAHANGARAIAVSTGGLSSEELHASTKAELVLSDLSHTEQVLEFVFAD